MAGFQRAPRPFYSTHARTRTMARTHFNARRAHLCRRWIHYCHLSVRHSYLSLDLLITTTLFHVVYTPTAKSFFFFFKLTYVHVTTKGARQPASALLKHKIKLIQRFCARLIHLFLAVNALRLTKRGVANVPATVVMSKLRLEMRAFAEPIALRGR